jgi:hypothetical protein
MASLPFSLRPLGLCGDVSTGVKKGLSRYSSSLRPYGKVKELADNGLEHLEGLSQLQLLALADTIVTDRA